MLSRKDKGECWKVVEQIVLDEYETIKNLTMRNSYYHILTFLAEKIGNGFSQEQYDYFEGNYEYFQADKWVAWEKKHNFKRPRSKDPTISLYNGTTQALAYIEERKFDFYRSQGFIFIEKSGFIPDLELLSENGWVILAGQGFSSREVRELIMKKYTKKPILVVHDFDFAGNMMSGVFSDGSKRTQHLDLTFENVLDVGLRKEDVEELDLPIQPESKKFQDKQKWRVELNALTVLIRREGINNPILWYICKRMKEEGVPLTKEEANSHFELNTDLRWFVGDKLDEIVEPIVMEQLENVEETEVIDVSYYKQQLEEDEEFISLLKEAVVKLTRLYLASAFYIDAPEQEQNVLLSAKVLKVENAERIDRRQPELIQSWKEFEEMKNEEYNLGVD